MNGRHEPDKREDPRHRRKYIAALVGLIVIGWATIAHATTDAVPPSSMSLTAAIVLGVVQGITEFLPISSDGHLALAQALLGLDGGAGGHRFTIAVHAGTLVAVIWTYRSDLIVLLRSLMKPVPDSGEAKLLLAIFVASLPLGLALLPGVEATVIAMESKIRLVGIALWVTALWLWIGFGYERRHPPKMVSTIPTWRQALWIGMVQVTAILPGISRSGTTIPAALLVGIDRATAARFSFLISIVAVGGAVAKEALSLALHPTPEAFVPAPYFVGFATAAIVGIAALRGLLLLVAKGRILGFVVYLAVVGAIAFAVG